MNDFWVVYVVRPHVGEFEIAGIFSKESDALEFRGELEKDWRFSGTAGPTRQEMAEILDDLVRDRLRELAEPIAKLAEHFT